jgi:hypothetical protein
MTSRDQQEHTYVFSMMFKHEAKCKLSYHVHQPHKVEKKRKYVTPSNSLQICADQPRELGVQVEDMYIEDI